MSVSDSGLEKTAFFSLDFVLRGLGKQWYFVRNIIARLQAFKLPFRERIKKNS
jgi:hypothetical protein